MKWTTLMLAALLPPVCLGVPGAAAAGFPETAITIVVPYPPGSTADTIPRLVGPLMSKSLGVPVIIENRGGANGSIGAVPSSELTIGAGVTAVFGKSIEGYPVPQWVMRED